MTENVSEIAEALKQRDTHDIALWLADIAADGTVPEERKRAMELICFIEKSEKTQVVFSDNFLHRH